MQYFPFQTYRFRRSLAWRNLVIVGLVVSHHGTWLLDQDGREVRQLSERHL